ncbi:MAG: radical SAM family heme chaperone HemW [Deltaproteobacteria bacterium]|nr:radical SAM family heme chaperone HemW [Deltaproteobacteria bacterium]
MNEKDPLGVYAHIPYCASKCPYCSFNSAAVIAVPEVRYTNCILNELDCYLEKDGIGGRGLESIYIGGGTPSLFSPPAIGRMVDGIKTRFVPSPDIETTLEVNPDSVDALRFEGYLAAGVTRVSIGAQSFDDAVLKTLGRRHPASKAVSAVKDAKAAGFENVGVDLIFGVPGQGMASWKAALTVAVELRPQHISVYGLTMEEDTPFYSLYGKSRDRAAVEEREAQMYETALGVLKGAGYLHYEISNFALPGFMSRGNRRYWLGGDYIGLGAGAHSFFSSQGGQYPPKWGLRRWNTADAVSYMESIEAKGVATDGSESPTETEARTEAALLGLRMLDTGIDAEAFKARFGVYPSAAFHNIEAFEKEGLLLLRGEDVLLTHKGALISNEILYRF